jgi:hypothetical protein
MQLKLLATLRCSSDDHSFDNKTLVICAIRFTHFNLVLGILTAIRDQFAAVIKNSVNWSVEYSKSICEQQSA